MNLTFFLYPFLYFILYPLTFILNNAVILNSFQDLSIPAESSLLARSGPFQPQASFHSEGIITLVIMFRFDPMGCRICWLNLDVNGKRWKRVTILPCATIKNVIELNNV